METTWDLTPLFPGLESPEFQRAWEGLKGRIGELKGLLEREAPLPEVLAALKLHALHGLEELGRLLDGHIEDLGDRLALEQDLQGLAVVALALADVAGDVDVGQEVHLDLDQPVALAGFAAAALDVEAEATGLVPADFRLVGLREQLADLVEHARVGRRVRARSSSDR